MTTPRARRNDALVAGLVRVGRDPRAVARLVRRGDLVVIDAVDLDVDTARRLAEAGPRAVVNLSRCDDARGGGLADLAATVPMYEALDLRLLGVADGQLGRLDVAEDQDATHVLRVGDVEAPLREVDSSTIVAREAVDPARAAAVGAHAAALLANELPALLAGDLVPGWGDRLEGATVVVVDAGLGWRAQWRRLRRAAKELRMVVVATGEVADAVARDTRIGAVIGSIEALNDATLNRVDLVISQSAADAERAAKRLTPLGKAHVVSSSWLSPADLAVAAAAGAGARIVVVLGRSAELANVAGSTEGASALVARMAAGPAWVEASTFLALHRSRWSRLLTWVWVLLAAVALGTAVALHPLVRDRLGDWIGW